MIDEILETHVGIKYLHIGCDEVYQLAQCNDCRELIHRKKWNSRDLFLNHVTTLARYATFKMSLFSIHIWLDIHSIKLNTVALDGQWIKNWLVTKFVFMGPKLYLVLSLLQCVRFQFGKEILIFLHSMYKQKLFIQVNHTKGFTCRWTKIFRYIEKKTEGRVKPLIWDDELRTMSIALLKTWNIGKLVEPVIWKYTADVEAHLTEDLWIK